jgi:hypothetical protein
MPNLTPQDARFRMIDARTGSFADPVTLDYLYALRLECLEFLDRINAQIERVEQVERKREQPDLPGLAGPGLVAIVDLDEDEIDDDEPVEEHPVDREYRTRARSEDL